MPFASVIINCMRQEPVEISVDGLTLRGNLYLPGKNAKNLAILFLHGWTGLPNEAAAQMLVQNGYTVMTICLSGHGKSDGIIEDQTREKSLKEILAAYDYLKSEISSDMPIGVVGNSYGGYMAAILASQRHVLCLQLRVPANYPDERFDELQLPQSPTMNPELFEWRNRALSPDSTKSLRAISDFSGPIQIIEAEEDERVPHQTVQNYVNAVKDKSKLDYHWMKGWPHSLGEDPERNRQYQEMLLTWLERI